MNDGKVTVSCYSSHVQNGCTAAKKYENKPVKAIFFHGYKLSGFKSLNFYKDMLKKSKKLLILLYEYSCEWLGFVIISLNVLLYIIRSLTITGTPQK